MRKEKLKSYLDLIMAGIEDPTRSDLGARRYAVGMLKLLLIEVMRPETDNVYTAAEIMPEVLAELDRRARVARARAEADGDDFFEPITESGRRVIYGDDDTDQDF